MQAIQIKTKHVYIVNRNIRIATKYIFAQFGPLNKIYGNKVKCKYIQWVRKVFRPPSIFHSLLYCSHLLKSFKFIFFLINVHTAPHIDRKTQNCWHFCRFIKTEKLKYHMVLSIQTLCCDTHIFNSGAVHFFWSSLRWFYTFIWVQLCLIILIGLD